MKNRVVGLTCAHTAEASQRCNRTQDSWNRGFGAICHEAVRNPSSHASRRFIAAYTAACQHGSGSVSGTKIPQHPAELWQGLLCAGCQYVSGWLPRRLPRQHNDADACRLRTKEIWCKEACLVQHIHGLQVGRAGVLPLPELGVRLVEQVQHDLVPRGGVRDDVLQHLPPPRHPLPWHRLGGVVRVELVVQQHVEAVGGEVAHLQHTPYPG